MLTIADSVERVFIRGAVLDAFIVHINVAGRTCIQTLVPKQDGVRPVRHICCLVAGCAG